MPKFVKISYKSAIDFAFLLGYYDGDGSWYGGLSGEIYSSNLNLLRQIKSVFNIKYRIRETTKKVVDEISNEIKHRAGYTLTLGSKLFEKMLASYNKSMLRKRP